MISEKMYEKFNNLEESRRRNIIKEIVQYESFFNDEKYNGNIKKENKLHPRFGICILENNEKKKRVYFRNNNMVFQSGADILEISFFDYLNRILYFNDNLFEQMMCSYLKKENNKYHSWNYDFNEEYKQMIKKKEYNRFLLGTGISLDYGVSSWKKIIKKMVAETKIIFPELKSKDILKKLFCNNYGIPQILKDIDKHKYHEVIYNSLYKKRKKKNMETNLSCLVNYISNLYDKGKEVEIVTFNYDDYLEKEFDNIRENKKRFVDYGSEYIKLKDIHSAVKIKHIHGYFPRGSILKSGKYISRYANSVVLTDEEYSKAYNSKDKYTAKTLLKFLEKSCLIIGNSVSDYEERKIFRTSKQNGNTYHFLLKKKSPSVDYDYYLNKFLISIGIIPVYFKDYDEIGSFLKDMCGGIKKQFR